MIRHTANKPRNTSSAIPSASGDIASQIPTEQATPLPPLNRRKTEQIDPTNAARATSGHHPGVEAGQARDQHRNQPLEHVAEKSDRRGLGAAGPCDVAHPDIPRADRARIKARQPADDYAGRYRADEIRSDE